MGHPVGTEPNKIIIVYETGSMVRRSRYLVRVRKEGFENLTITGEIEGKREKGSELLT